MPRSSAIAFPRPIRSVVKEDLVITLRKIAEGGRGFEDGTSNTTRYLAVPPPKSDPDPRDIAVTIPTPDHMVDRVARTAEKKWFELLFREATRRPPTAEPASAPADDSLPVAGDVVVFIHGYNNNPRAIMKRHRQLRKDLAARGYAGAVISFDWPSGSDTIDYIADRFKAHMAAPRLVTDLILPFAARTRLGDCRVNVHVVAHSTGGYLFQEAADLADEHKGAADVHWSVSQLILIGADVEQRAIHDGHGDAESMVRHCVRLTNYSNPFDSVLKLSNTKRIGIEPRIGRVGLPRGAPQSAVNVNCGTYFNQHRKRGSRPFYGHEEHSWHIGDPVWADDLFLTLQGDIDRNFFPTRTTGEDGSLFLRKPPA